jgi:DNA repair protein SbcC/Rad50
MEIRAVTLKNFKVHTESHYEFHKGTNAICGENGAGKTSILEAIAWVLFDYSDYTRGELIRNGAKSAEVTVSFCSQADGRVYDVKRSTSSTSSRGYRIYDPQLNANLELRKLEDIQQWLRHHIGVPANTDLPRLFAETIGIPQGTFTADFLKRPADRKKMFDPILKVEEYKQVYDQTRNLESYARQKVILLEKTLSDLEQRLVDWPTLKQQAQDLQQAIATDETLLQTLAKQMQQVQTELDRLNAEAQQLQILDQKIRQLEPELASKTAATRSLEELWRSAQQAFKICTQLREDFQTYEKAQKALEAIAEQRKQQQHLLQQREQLQHQLRDREVALSQLDGQLATFATVQNSITQWQTQLPHQEHLEQSLNQVQQTLHGLTPLRNHLQTLHQQQTQKQTQYRVLQSELEKLKALHTQVETLPQLEEKRQTLQTHISRLQAATALAAELQPIIDSAHTHRERLKQQVSKAKIVLQQSHSSSSDAEIVQQALNAGVAASTQILQSVETLQQNLTEADAIISLKQQLQHLQETIHNIQLLQQQWAQLPLRQQQATALLEDLKQLQQQEKECDLQLVQEVPLRQKMAKLEANLQDLNDPRGHLRLLQQQLQRQTQLQSQWQRQQQGVAKLKQDADRLQEQLTHFTELETQTEAQRQLLQTLQDSYQQYLRHRNEANLFKERDQQKRALQTELQTLQTNLSQLQQDWKAAQQAHDAERLKECTSQLNDLQRQHHQTQGGLLPKKDQLTALNEQLQHRQALADQQENDRRSLQQKQEILQFITDARSIYNQSGPRITKYYLAEISHEADRLFRELLSRPDVMLQWTEDYDIQVQERGYWRSFKSLSGGEQMCAALAVRLALLKVLADINIAFFDEPTTNMDQQRRQQLAEAIGNLKSLQQLIVISHDDTFESVTDHLIRVERQN